MPPYYTSKDSGFIIFNALLQYGYQLERLGVIRKKCDITQNPLWRTSKDGGLSF